MLPDIKRLDINSGEMEPVIEMLYNWWGEEEGWPKEIFKELIKSRCTGINVPVIWVAVVKNEVVGTISLVANSLDFRQDLYPVVTSFFVQEKYRNMGIARRLMQELIKHCASKFNTIYLASEVDGFYEKFGFKYVETCKCYYNMKQNKIIYAKVYSKNF